MNNIEKYLLLLKYEIEGNLEMVKNLLTHKNINGILGYNEYINPPLYIALQLQQYKLVEYLLENGADPNIAIYTFGVGFSDYEKPPIKFPNYTTFLSYSISKEGELYSQDFELEPRLESINLLIKYGADINGRNQKWDTPLDVAKDNFHYKAEELLISLGGKTSKELEENEGNTITSLYK